MTTGRINQVTISVCTSGLTNEPLRTAPVHAVTRTAFHSGRSLQGFKNAYVNPPTTPQRIPQQNESRHVLSNRKAGRRNTLFPVLTSFRQALPVQRTRITVFGGGLPAAGTPKRWRHNHGISPRSLIAALGLAIGKQSTSFHSADEGRKGT